MQLHRTAAAGCCPSRNSLLRQPVSLRPQHRLSTAPSLQFRPSVSTRAQADDPYQVLGIKPDADNNEINRAYSKRKFEHKGNPAMLNKLEAAHGQIMMAAFNARIRGGTAVPKEVKYADREALFPWKPKRWDATPKIIMIFGGIQLLLVSFAFQSPNISKAIGSMLVGIAGNVMKQNAIYPPLQTLIWRQRKRQADVFIGTCAALIVLAAGRNFVRGVLLGLGATCVGLVLASFPEALQKTLDITLPIAPATAVAIKVAFAAICNWVMTSYFY